MKRNLDPVAGLNFDPTSVGFFRIRSWNASAKLKPANVGEVLQVDKPAELRRNDQREDWVDSANFQAYLDQEKQANTGAPCPTLVGYEDDTRKQGGETLRLQVAKSWYYQHVAARRYLRDHPDEYDRVVSRIIKDGQEGGLRRTIRSSPNSNIVINVTVQSRDDRLLMIRRPTGARTWGSFYQVGAHETMNWLDPGGRMENCYELATRALDEEIGLTDPRDYYDNIVFSWFGFYAVEASAYFFAHVRTRLEEDELVQRISAASGAFEVEDIDWYELNLPTLKRVLEAWSDGPWHAKHDENGRKYLPHSTMSLTQLWRISGQGML